MPRNRPKNLRAELVESLTKAVSVAVASGDLHVAQVAHKALGRIVGDGDSPVVADFATEQAKRRGGKRESLGARTPTRVAALSPDTVG